MEQGSGGASWERTVYTGIGLVFALLLAVYLVYKIAVVVLVLLVTLLFSIIISAPVDYLGRRGVGRGWGTLAVLGALALLFGIFGMALAPVVTSQATQLVETFPTLLESAQQIVVRVQNVFGLDTAFRLDQKATGAALTDREFAVRSAPGWVARRRWVTRRIQEIVYRFVFATLLGRARPETRETVQSWLRYLARPLHFALRQIRS